MVRRAATARPATGRFWAVLTASAAAIAFALSASAEEVSLGHAIGGVCPDCDFSGRDLHGASIVGNLPRTDFSGAILTTARLGGNFAFAILTRADLTDASIESANFVNSDLAGAKLDGATINGTNFFAVDLTGATLRGVEASWTNFSASNFLGAKLDDAKLDAVKLARAEFTRAELPRATLIGADIAGARFEDAILTEANLSGVNATRASFTGANLTGATLEGAVLKGADLSGAIGLTAEALASACGDEDTRLPAGLSVGVCPARAAGAGPRGGFAPVEAEGSDPAWAFSFAPTGGREQLEAVLADSDSARRAVRRLMDAQQSLDVAFKASHALLDLGLRDAIQTARDTVGEMSVAEIAASDVEIVDVLGALDQIRVDDASAEVSGALQSARASLNGVLVEMAAVREELSAASPSGVFGSAEEERARRHALLDRELAMRTRAIDREVDARLRTLDAECFTALNALDAEDEALTAQLTGAERSERAALERAAADLAARREGVETDCSDRERAALEQQRLKLGEIDTEIADRRSRIEAEVAELQRRNMLARQVQSQAQN